MGKTGFTQGHQLVLASSSLRGWEVRDIFQHHYSTIVLLMLSADRVIFWGNFVREAGIVGVVVYAVILAASNYSAGLTSLVP